jgi:CheY-like chemotaxis protein
VPILIAGRKLLLADDSIAIQKVIDLTFTDEGMEVTTVGDGQDALDKLDQFKPDVVLADVYMPGVDGYELCKFIKQNERFSDVPVMLLIGTFEPFDEAEAKLAGADDVVTKPFQSIRQLVSRVGSLLSSQPVQKDESLNEYSTLGLAQSEPAVSDLQMQDQPDQPNVRVFVEAPVMAEAEPEHVQEHECSPNIELQTADTRQLEPIEEVPVTVIADTIEIEPVPVSEEPEIPYDEIASTPDEYMSYQPSEFASQGYDDSVLDLGEVDNFASAESEDDFVLDLEDGEAPAPVWSQAAEPEAQPAELAVSSGYVEPSYVEPSYPEPEMYAESAAADTQEWAVVTPVVDPQNWEVRTDEAATAELRQANVADLSPEAIEAISRRVVEHLSDKVVREIAWEVVPELSELLIKKRLEEQK